jgi:hypothetical protein
MDSHEKLYQLINELYQLPQTEVGHGMIGHKCLDPLDRVDMREIIDIDTGVRTPRRRRP